MANLYRADLIGACLVRVNLTNAGLNSTNLFGANFTGAILTGINLNMANLSEAIFHEADLREAILNAATLYHTDLSNADLSEAYLEYASLVETNLNAANLTACRIYGISAWNVQLDGAIQSNLIITPDDEPTITVDNLKVAQFIYLLLSNEEIRDVIDTVAKKAVLILGRFTPERKAVLDALREALRIMGYLPILFDFDKPSSRDLTETVSILAHLGRFIIVDLTDPSSAPHEVATIIPHCVVPVQPLLSLQPLIVEGKAVERREYAMFHDLRRRHPWVLPTFRYQDTVDLLASLKEHIIEPAEQKAKELAQQ